MTNQRKNPVHDLTSLRKEKETKEKAAPSSSFLPPKAKIIGSRLVIDGSDVQAKVVGIGSHLDVSGGKIDKSTAKFFASGQVFMDYKEIKVLSNSKFTTTLTEDLPRPSILAPIEEKLKDIQKRLDMDPQADKERKFIETSPALKAYYLKLQEIGWYFISAQALAGNQVEGAKNKMDTASNMVAAGIGSVPVPGLGLVSEGVKEIIGYFNDKYRHGKAEKLAHLGVNPGLATHIAECFARRMTLARIKDIGELSDKNNMAKKTLTKRLKDFFSKSKETAKKYSEIEKLALADLLEVVEAIYKDNLKPSESLDYVAQLEKNVQEMLNLFGVGPEKSDEEQEEDTLEQHETKKSSSARTDERKHEGAGGTTGKLMTTFGAKPLPSWVEPSTTVSYEQGRICLVLPKEIKKNTSPNALLLFERIVGGKREVFSYGLDITESRKLKINKSQNFTEDTFKKLKDTMNFYPALINHDSTEAITKQLNQQGSHLHPIQDPINPLDAWIKWYDELQSQFGVSRVSHMETAPSTSKEKELRPENSDIEEENSVEQEDTHVYTSLFN